MKIKPECWNWQTGTVQNRVSLRRESSSLSSGTHSTELRVNHAEVLELPVRRRIRHETRLDKPSEIA